ncbi:LacI family DNA-binding transcriptional regulator [Arthrobacter bambusae]|uniref:LacI family transcriptional regulator n=1 Tax=Arthrobacter bambusae TaxID=1338426 RepID=A0AAW8DAT0_9MICC|nr:LacI family DNA-binding transcriptional regulator [Arthrobacter bambusae]MDP9905437.1 LacI family transcriptional regulator [Arthrobacter bambusae]MDQ0127481.1 LacI family transcriptional regulator [Arthrobacter bambusae]MDQ0178823.1 LacI family transcriptional regulator [Arthrobacter bambusae]
MKNVADLAGVGIKTVSRVVNNEPGVSEETRQRVLRASEQLQYHLDITAGSLKRSGRKTQSIGLLLPSVSNPFSGEIHRALEDALAERGIAVFASSLDDDPGREKKLISAFLGRRVDGLVLTPIARSQAYVIPEHSRNLPMVFIDREPVGIEADAVVTDNEVGAAKAAAHLIRHGHTRLAYLGDRTDIQTATKRRTGFLEEIGRAGIATSTIPVRNGLHDEETALRAALELLTSENPPTAIFSSQNLVTFGAMRALKSLGLHHSVALIGFDDFTLADMMEPGITVIAQHPERIGKTAAERILARIDGDDGAPKTYIVPSELIPRGSGEILPLT